MCAPPCDLVRLKPKAPTRGQFQTENMPRRSRPLPPFKVVAISQPANHNKIRDKFRFEVRDWWDVPCRDGVCCRKGNRCLFRHDVDTSNEIVVSHHYSYVEAAKDAVSRTLHEALARDLTRALYPAIASTLL